jgi:hypothetical protein
MSKRKKTSTPSFNQILEETRWSCARAAWERARTAGKLRHGAIAAQRYRAAKVLGAIKMRAMMRTCELAPQQVRIGIDQTAHRGLLSVGFRQHGRLHVRPGREEPILAALRGVSS